MSRFLGSQPHLLFDACVRPLAPAITVLLIVGCSSLPEHPFRKANWQHSTNIGVTESNRASQKPVPSSQPASQIEPDEPSEIAAMESSRAGRADGVQPASLVVPAAGEAESEYVPPAPRSAADNQIYVIPSLPADEGLPGNQIPGTLQLEDVIASVYRAYPLLDAALRQRDIAAGNQLAAAGAFDVKITAGAEDQPLGFYETYRHNIKISQPLYSGGEAFGMYRVGRGDFEPWYLNRQTNAGGEFKAGVSVPLSRNRSIDERRAAVWNTTYGRQLVEFEIQAELIDFVLQSSYAYWDWVAAGAKHQIAESLLDLARERNAGIERQVELGDKEPPVLQDNRRLIVSREAKLIEAGRKVQQTAVKLSLYYRAGDGRPEIPGPGQIPEFPAPEPVFEASIDGDIEVALDRRPELRVLNLMHRQLEVDYAQAHNEFRPAVDAILTGSQDVGAPTSFKQYKSPFELEAGLVIDLAVQRRKARGKMGAVQGKLAQLNAKRRITQDKIATEVQATYAALVAARERVVRARESVVLADQMAVIERRKFEVGEGTSDLFTVNLREQQAAEAAEVLVDTLLEAFRAQADYRAALALDEPPGEG